MAEKLVSLARTEADKKKDRERFTDIEQQEDFPWGVNVHLRDEELEKLGLDGASLDSDDRVSIVAEGMVTTSNSRSIGGKKSHDVTIQLQKMAISPMKDSDTERADTLFGDDDES